jgi:hypothetical protein
VLISTTGATIEVPSTPDDDLLDQVLHVRVAPASAPDVLQFEGAIVKQQLLRRGRTRVHVRFVQTRLEPEEVLELLFRLRPR